ncbi:MAG: branched-chain amino acid ABC transporter permease, partial [Betaproteobacteria bacterium]|nr:branched-chain amino acid ABC transporter permease [Betaproteobacteria bacterium]
MKITTARWIAIVAGVIALALLPLGLKAYGIYLLSLWCVYVMANFGLNLIVGYTGLMSLCQAAFLGVGAYTAGILMNMGFPFWVVVPVAAVNCFVLGLVIGFPALRVQHHYLAFATLGFNVLVSLFMRNE